MKRLLVFLVSVAGLWSLLNVSQPGKAQILMVTGEYRLTELDQNNQRFGVALLEASPDKTQNWVYLDTKTDINHKITNRAGWSKEQKLNFYQFFEQAKVGTVVKVNGGRRWDGEISAKTLWLGYPSKD